MNPESSLQRMQSNGQAFQSKRVNQENRKIRGVHFWLPDFS